MFINKKLVNKLWYSYIMENYEFLKKRVCFLCIDDKESFLRCIIEKKK